MLLTRATLDTSSTLMISSASMLSALPSSSSSPPAEKRKARSFGVYSSQIKRNSASGAYKSHGDLEKEERLYRNPSCSFSRASRHSQKNKLSAKGYCLLARASITPLSSRRAFPRETLSLSFENHMSILHRATRAPGRSYGGVFRRRRRYTKRLVASNSSGRHVFQWTVIY